MNITDSIPIMLRRAASRDLSRARRQWPQGITLCVAVVVLVFLWGG